jgi:hypothetical protein
VAVNENGLLIAFEAKVERWRKALHQAYRNRCFANLSYVLLPPETARKAQRYAIEFSRRGVGLCSVDIDTIVILHDATHTEPIQPWLRENAISHAQA